MTYSSMALVALVTHCIINYNALRNRHYGNSTPTGKAYHLLLLGVGLFYIFDSLWGVLFDAHLLTVLFVDTELYFVAMTATIFFWIRYVVNYLEEESRLTPVLRHTGWFFLAFESIVILLNPFFHILFWFDENGSYHAGSMRYVTLALQIIIFVLSACYVLITARNKEQKFRRHHLAIGTFGITMAVMVIMQTVYPLLPMYSIGCLFGTCILHTFVLEDMKEDRRNELEEMIRREEAQKQELGSAKQLAYKDSLTGVRSYNSFAEAEHETDEMIYRGELQDFGIIVFDVNNLKQTNDTRGHDAGDTLLKNACHLICSQFKHSPVYRIGGDEFVAILRGEDYQNRAMLLADFDAAVNDNLHNGTIVVASGLATFRHGQDHNFRDVFERADSRMYQRKGQLKSTVS